MVDAVNRLSGATGPDKGVPKHPVTQKPVVPESEAKDTVQISERARAAKQVENYVQFVKNLPDVRAERVKAAREDVDKDTLLTEEATEDLASRVVRALTNL
jgi:predicted ThiF/HesA family dinucleotide-utilizing enzyme